MTSYWGQLKKQMSQSLPKEKGPNHKKKESQPKNEKLKNSQNGNNKRMMMLDFHSKYLWVFLFYENMEQLTNVGYR